LTLCKHFGRYGPIGSVKIMWPRPYDDRSSKNSGRLSGFVAFMHREDAAQALKNLDGSTLFDNSLRCVWGKAVPLPAKPIYGDYMIINRLLYIYNNAY
jgi:U2-associated protein SR140